MNELIKYFNNKYSKTYGKIAYPRTTIQIYRVYQAIKSYGINDDKLVELLHNVKLPKPRNTEEWELYVYCLYNKDDSEMVIDTSNLISKENPVFTGSMSMNRKEGATIGEYSVAIGKTVEASGECSYAEGKNTTASGWSSHAEGEETKAKGQTSHAEGDNSIAEGISSHAEGSYAVASGITSHAEGEGTKAYGKSSHAEGSFTTASSNYQHVQGKYNIEDKSNKYAHIVGNGKSGMERSNAHTLDWKGNAWFAGDVQANNVPYVISEKVVLTVPAASISAKKSEIDNNTGADPVRISIDTTVTYDPTKSYYVKYNNTQYHVVYTEGVFGIVEDNCECLIISSNGNPVLMVFSLDTTNITDMQLIEKDIKKLDTMYIPDDLNVNNSMTLGIRKGRTGVLSSSFGFNCEASGDYSHAEGDNTTASGNYSHAEGSGTTALGENSHAEGKNTTASDEFSHAEGQDTTASGEASHAEGYNTIASGNNSHAEGYKTTTSAPYSHAEGECTTASGFASHAEGGNTTASGDYSHAEGYGTTALGQQQHVQGKYNIEDTESKYAHIVGNGTNTSKSNAHTLDWDGNAWYAGKLSQEGIPTEDKDLVTKKYVDDSRDNLVSNIYGNNIYNFQITEDEFNSLCNLLYNDRNNKIALNSISSDTLNTIINGHTWYNAISFNKKIILKVKSTGSGGLVVYTKGESTDGHVNYTLLSLKSNESNIVTISYTSFIEYNYNDNITNLGILNNKVNIQKGTKNQYINATKDFELVLPNVTEYIEIHLYLTPSSTVSITFPPSIKWKDVPTIEANKVYEIIFKYINETIGWIGEYKIYN